MKILVDNRPIECKEGELLIDVLINNGVEIPHFCYQQDLGMDGNCRMCMVEIKGQKRPQIACDTFVCENLEVATKSEKINEVKRSILELELLNHPVDCPICDQAGECKLQDYYMDYGLYESHLCTPKTKKGKHIDLGSNVILDQERCVLCMRCVRFTSNITKTGELGVIGRGDKARIAVAPNHKLQNPYAMNVVELCPVGALTSKDFRFAQRVWFLDSAKSICHGCSRGCNIFIDYNETKYTNEKVYRFRARRNKEINLSFLCDFGRLSYRELNESADCFVVPPRNDGYMGSVAIQNSDEMNHCERSTVIYSSNEMSHCEQSAVIYSSNEMSHCEQSAAIYNSDFVRNLLHIKKKVALASPSLSLEQLQAIQEFCQKYKVALFSLPYIDESFGDDWLKTNDRSANFAGVKELNISTCQEEFESSLKSAEVVINFDHNLLKSHMRGERMRGSALGVPENKNIIHFSTSKCEHGTVLAIANFAHESGTLINCDGLRQEFYATKYKSEAPSLIELLEVLK
ncbi:MAG: 2Fe-2S iron-sulfur cluster-binding protein [Campylobacterales bacterium]|nr:2Fe-2S iron-sulfur cluster-binding protein [Campylobacterales bacterium]